MKLIVRTLPFVGTAACVLLLSFAAVGKDTSKSSSPSTRSPSTSARARTSASATAATPGLPSDSEIQTALNDARAKFKNLREGKNADYIPYLAKVDPNLFGLAIVTVDGKVFRAGDANSEFPIESIAKPFTLAMVLEEKGPQFVADKIGVDATGQPFNSITAIEQNKETHPAGNPLVNAGAIATVSYVKANGAAERWSKIQNNLDCFAGRDLKLNNEVYKSEAETNTRNQAISRLLEAYESLGSKPDEALDVYTKECSVNLNTADLAAMGATLANAGVNPISGQQIVSPDTARRTLAVMGTNGLYENTGEWMFKVGAPSKSGVGGGLVTVVPGKLAIAAFSPPLDKAGNSVRAQRAIQQIVEQLHLNPLGSAPAVGGAGRAGTPPSDQPKQQ